MKKMNYETVCLELIKAQQDAIRLKHRLIEVEQTVRDNVSGPEYMMIWRMVRDIKQIQEHIKSLHSNYGPF